MTRARHPVTVPPAELSVGADGTVSSLTYDDIYHARQGALAQARHVFLGGNGLNAGNARWREADSFCILETGFGLGINFLATWQAWRRDDCRGHLHFVSVEQHPLTHTTLAQVLRNHAELTEIADLTEQLIAAWPLALAGVHRLHFPADRVTLTLVFGDANNCLTQLNMQADALYLDGFSPQKNPQMWSPRVLGALTRLCKHGSSLATWCVAGEVRRQLHYRGWQLERTPGLAGKRQMLQGHLQTDNRAVSQRLTSDQRRALVIGAGLAGCAVSERLASRGWQISLYERKARPAQEASGNPAGILLPRLALDDALAARLARAAYLYALQTLRQTGAALRWQRCGVMQLAEDAKDEDYQRAVIARLALPAEFACFLERAEASAQLGMATARGGWWFPEGAWASPASLCQALLNKADKKLTPHFSTAVDRIAYSDGQWQLFAVDGRQLDEAPHLILANAHSVAQLLGDHGTPELPLETIRGQVSFLPPGEFSTLAQVVCGPAYLTPPAGAFACVGATFDRNDCSLELRAADHRRNLAELAAMLPDAAPQLQSLADTALDGRVGLRCMSRDKLPLVGTLTDNTVAAATSPRASNLPRLPGLHCLLGLGARGMLWAPLAAELLASQLNGDPLPVKQAMVDALDPGRFYLRTLHQRKPT